MKSYTFDTTRLARKLCIIYIYNYNYNYNY